ncbi:hypothetical protein KIN20_000118 [Parelaphostrongylus tenuis]|uniref:Uncharacterized protein n=1 Tax=Parelaphostrongylus tenuis TaxID=148309 RepID=A0AAD5LS02_PARTN|nr:hypothetical protein KIN20_000118 [Parelaphostrongylus tenuis]
MPLIIHKRMQVERDYGDVFAQVVLTSPFRAETPRQSGQTSQVMVEIKSLTCELFEVDK